MAYKILTVDDSKTIRMIVKKAFKPYNCELFEGENGVEGLAHRRQRTTRLDHPGHHHARDDWYRDARQA